MDIKLAIKIIDDKRSIYGMTLLDMAIVMKEQLANDELDNREAAAIRVFLREGRKLLAPAGYTAEELERYNPYNQWMKEK